MTLPNYNCSYCGQNAHQAKVCYACKKQQQLDKPRRLVLNAYKKWTLPSCDCCEEVFEGSLCIDHINRDGAQHREQIGRGSTTLYRWLANNGFPSGYRILCFNCNGEREKHGGYYCSNPQHSLNRIKAQIKHTGAYSEWKGSVPALISDLTLSLS
jgi:hypothetical protein